jgi:ribokinase
MREQFPGARVVLTLGKDGAMYFDAETAVSVPAGKGKPVDTTAAGDTFTGYFFTGIASGKTPEKALRFATRASDITVTRKGAAESTPFVWEVEA